jgi:hypothetical protein
MSDQWAFVKVPPPKTVPVDDLARNLGLLPGLRAEQHNSLFRCSSCNNMQVEPEQIMVWVPDSVMRHDSAEAIAEICRRSAFNGSSSGWCLTCAKKLGKG